MPATEFLRTEVPEAATAKVVQFVSEKVGTPQYYQLTEPLWLRIVKTYSFDQVSRLLATSESKIRKDPPQHRSVFYLQLLKSLIWIAPAPWTQQMIDGLETRSIELDYQSQADLDFLGELQALLQHEHPGVDRHPVRSQLLHAIQLTCQGENNSNVAEVLGLLSDAANEPAAMQAAFLVPGEEYEKVWGNRVRRTGRLDRRGITLFLSMVVQEIFAAASREVASSRSDESLFESHARPLVSVRAFQQRTLGSTIDASPNHCEPI